MDFRLNKMTIYLKSRIFFFVLIIVLSAKISNAQDAVFSQFYTASMFLNPALAADKQGINASFNNRTLTNQEISSYNLNQLTVIYPFRLTKFIYGPTTKFDHRSGLGLTVYREGTGDHAQLNTLGIVLSLAHSVQIAKEHYLGLGIQGGYIHKDHNNDFLWGSQYDPDNGYNPSLTPSVQDVLSLTSDFPVFNVGLVWFYKNSELKEYIRKFNVDAFAGISFYNVNTPNQSFIKGSESEVPVQMKLHGGLFYKASKIISIMPNMIWVTQNGNNQVNLGSYASFTTPDFALQEKNIHALAGVWYRWGDSFIASIGSTIYSFTFAVSYDFNTSNFNYNNRGKGIIEFSLKYEMAPKKESLQRGLLY